MMKRRPGPRSLALACLVGLAVAGCGSAREPSGASGPDGPLPSDAAVASESADVITTQLAGPWRRSPILLDDKHIAIISDACAAAAREKFGEVEANLPTAVIDARGEHLGLAILADDLNAIQCFVRLDDSGLVASVMGVQRLSMTTTAPVDGSAISVASLFHDYDPANPRTYAFGRIGPIPEAAKVGFDDASVILASDAAGWWAMWWKGMTRASSYAAVDKASIVVGNTKPFDGERESALGPASWWLDPKAPKPTPSLTRVHALVDEQGCSSGQTADGRVEPPAITWTDTTVTVTFEVRRIGSVATCQGIDGPTVITIDLSEPLGKRVLLDGGSNPPRDASKAPA